MRSFVVNRGQPPVLRRAIRLRFQLLGALFASALAMLVASAVVLAGEGNSDYLGILSSTAPSGYTPSPASYDLSAGQNMLVFKFNVTNKTAQQQSMSLQLNVNHILTYRGLNVADGQPGVTNGAVVDGQFDETQSTQVQDSSPTLTSFTIAPNATETVTMSRALRAGACGYYQVDVAKAGMTSQKGLEGLEIRVLGCTTQVVASPSPSPTPTGGTGGVESSPSASPSAVPTPSGGTGAGTSSSPGAGTVAGTTTTSPGVGSGSVLGATTSGGGVALANTGLPFVTGLMGLLLMALGGIGIIRRK